MNYLHLLVEYLTTGQSWRGADGIPNRLVEHLELTVIATVLACLVALPVGLWLGHLRRGGTWAVNVAGAGRAVPTFAVLVLFYILFGEHRNVEIVAALMLFAAAPLLTNAYVGVRSVDADVVEAARGMGMSGTQVLRRVELPLAAPLLLAGLRIAVVQVVATATIAAYIGGGGLGRLVLDGFSQHQYGPLLAGALLVAVLALVLDGLLALAANRIDPTRGFAGRDGGRTARRTSTKPTGHARPGRGTQKVTS